ncbi:hypothetical protein [Nocardioides sp.]|uniref:hypothetical protein n=1 Tax=Nocardioides sp. TaxID=35761 RepID=UPI0035110515
MDDVDEPPFAWGLVQTEERGALPFALVHGEALAAAAAWALGAAEVALVDATVGWAGLADAGDPVVLHDSRCPLLPPASIAACLRPAVDEDVVVLGVRPVTDTIKQVEVARAGDGAPEAVLLGATLDREALRAVAAPLVLTPAAVGRVAAWCAEQGCEDAPAESALVTLGLDDPGVLAHRLRAEGLDVRQVEVPPQGRRVQDRDDLAVLEALAGR